MPNEEELITEIVNNNGKGHKKLQEKVEEGEVSKELAAFIKLKATLRILKNKISALNSIS